jgi:hypothetical protein
VRTDEHGIISYPLRRGLWRCAGLPALAVVGTTSCGTPKAAGPDLSVVDCVGVLGGLPPFAEEPLTTVPYSGVDRSKLLGELSDDEATRLCNFVACTTANGYGRNCYSSNSPFPLFELNTVPILASGVQSCWPSQGGVSQYVAASVGDCIETYQTYFSTCHVGPWEDCVRELAWEPFGGAEAIPIAACGTNSVECPVQ